MAYVARLSDLVRGGVAGANLQEGLAVRLTQSGLHADLPVFELANAGEVGNVFILFAAVDNFERPTDAGMYTANWYTTENRFDNASYTDPIETRTVYKVGMSVLWNPTIPEGALAQGHRGGTYAVPSGAFVDSVNIRVPGNKIAVGADGKWTYVATETTAVGYVEEFNTVNQVLIFTLKQ